MRYYEYISRSKIEMLHPQIPVSYLSRLIPKRSVSISTPIGGMSLGNATSGALLDMLEDVEHYLEESAVIGTVDAPKEYIKAILDLKVGSPVDCSPIGIYSMAVWASLSAQIAFVGSTHHLIGVVQQTSSWWNASQLRHVLFFLDRLAEANLPSKRLSDAGIVLPEGVVSSDRDWLTGKSSEDWNVSTYCELLSHLVHRAPAQRYEVLARVMLLEEDPTKEPALLATPLFVAAVAAE